MGDIMMTKQPSGPAAAPCAALRGPSAQTLAGNLALHQPLGGWDDIQYLHIFGADGQLQIWLLRAGAPCEVLLRVELSMQQVSSSAIPEILSV